MNVKFTYINPENIEKAISDAWIVGRNYQSPVDVSIIYNEQAKQKTVKPEPERAKSCDLGEAYDTISRFIRENLDPHCAVVVTADDVTVIRKEGHYPLDQNDSCPEE